MNLGGDSAEQIVRLSLEGLEVTAKITGAAAKNISMLLLAVLREEKKTKGRARLTNMIRSGKELTVFSLQKKDIERFTQEAKKYGILYCVIKDKDSKSENAVIDIIARAEDASKISRIVEKFDLAKVDKASVVRQAERDLSMRNEMSRDVPIKDKGDNLLDEILAKPIGKEKESLNPYIGKTEKSPLSEPNSTNQSLSMTGTSKMDEGRADRPSVKEKLDSYKREERGGKEAPKEKEFQKGEMKPRKAPVKKKNRKGRER